MLAQNTSNQQQANAGVEDDVEIFETANALDDFEALNEEKQYSRYNVMSYMQENHNIDQEPVDKANADKYFEAQAKLAKVNKFNLQTSRKAKIAHRLVNIR